MSMFMYDPQIIKLKKALGVKGKQIGRGAYAAVYATENDTVIKITEDWSHYAFVAGSDKDNPCLPRMLKDMSGLCPSGIYAYETERLFAPGKLGRKKDVKDIVDKVDHAKRTVPYTNSFDADIVKQVSNSVEPGYMKDALDYVRDFINGRGDCSLDLHEGNIMCRADGTLVITDPVAAR